MYFHLLSPFIKKGYISFRMTSLVFVGKSVVADTGPSFSRSLLLEPYRYRDCISDKTSLKSSA